MPSLPLYRRSVSALVCVVCALSSPLPAAAQDHENSVLMPQVAQCHALLTSAPATSLQMARALLARPRLGAAEEIGALGCLGAALRTQGQPDQAETVPARLLAAADRADAAPLDRNRARAMAAQLLLWRGNLPQALSLSTALLDEAVRERDVQGQIAALVQIAMIRGDAMGDAQGALTYLERASALSQHLRRPPNAGDLLLDYNIGYALLSMQRYEEALTAFDRAQAIGARLTGQELHLYRIASHRAEIQRVRGQYAAAEAGLQRALAWQTGQDPQGRVVTLQRLARLALDRHAPAQALALAEQAQALAESGHYLDEIRQGLDVLADAHSLLGHRQQLLQVSRQARQLDQARSKGETLGQLARLQANAERNVQPVQVNAEQELARMRVLRNGALVALLGVLALATTLVLRLRRQRRELAALSRTDAVTGLPNRHQVERMLAHAGTAGHGQRSALVLLEIDDFKTLNDQHGNLAGDVLLRAVARCLVAAVDGGDVVARWGGASFLVARADTSEAAAQALASHLRASVERLLVDTPGGQPVTFSASLGVAPLPLFADRPAQLDDSLRAADRALQSARRSGRNAWASLWGEAAGSDVDLYSLLHDPAQAMALGWVSLGGSRPMPWAPPRPPPQRLPGAEASAAPPRREHGH
ncbi:diguanylate cyclase [Stenotrophomonas sp.]|uniref:GGDEF domain-containing protein n=1 Tax=Stenotrophomonas sp. TaxID=69392 RepID=UPI002FCC9E8D